MRGNQITLGCMVGLQYPNNILLRDAWQSVARFNKRLTCMIKEQDANVVAVNVKHVFESVI